MADHMLKTCALCPFSRTKTLTLHPDRAEEFAYMSSNPYSDFPCHKTAGYDDRDDDLGDSGGFVRGPNSKTCHGFLTLQREENGVDDDDFKPDGDGFSDIYEMIDHHQKLWAERYPNNPNEVQ